MKIGIIVSLIISSFLISCSKTYTCTCYTNGTTEVDIYSVTNTKKKATKYCKASEGTTKTCTLEY